MKLSDQQKQIKKLRYSYRVGTNPQLHLYRISGKIIEWYMPLHGEKWIISVLCDAPIGFDPIPTIEKSTNPISREGARKLFSKAFK